MDWSKWATPEGARAVVELILTIMALVTAVLALLGHRAAAAKVQGLEDDLEANKAKVVTASKVAIALVQGVQKFRDGAPADAAEGVKLAIQNATTTLGVEHIVQPLVKAVTEGQGSVDAALQAQQKPAS